MNITKLLVFLLTFSLTAVICAEETKDKPVDPVQNALAGMSMIERYCSGVATLDYSIATLRAQGVGKIDAATAVVKELIKAFPDEPPIGIKYMVATLTQDVYEHRSLHVDTLVAYHFYSCIEGVSSKKGMILGDSRLYENIIEAVSCEGPGVNMYTCLMNIFGFDIPDNVRDGSGR